MKQSAWSQVVVLFGAVLGALLVGALLLVLAGANPLVAYQAMLTGPLSSRYGLTETLVKATPLLLVGLGIVIAFRNGILNIGAEGQIMIGALAGTAFALALPNLSGVLLLPLTLLISFAGGAIWGGIPGWLKAYLGVNEILSTVMLNSIATQLVTFMLRGVLIDPQEVAYGTGFPQTAPLPRSIWLGRLLPRTRLHVGFVLALVFAGLVYVFLWRTSLGYRMRAVGAQKEAARYGGVRVELTLVLAMALSGGFAGLAGMVEVLGIHHRLLNGVSAGYGFSGIVAALFGRLHPLGAIPASILFGALMLGADMMQRAVEVPAAIVFTIQGLVVLFVVGSDLFVRRPAFARRLFNLRRLVAPMRSSTSEDVA
jgi:ABC-type uncharacterized transport system permease subunit